MIKWTKPNDTTIETNDDPANIKAAENLGWKRADGKKAPSPKTKATDNKKG